MISRLSANASVDWCKVATISRLLKIIGLFCKRALLKRLYSAKETYDFKEPTNCSHPICGTRRKKERERLARLWLWQSCGRPATVKETISSCSWPPCTSSYPYFPCPWSLFKGSVSWHDWERTHNCIASQLEGAHQPGYGVCDMTHLYVAWRCLRHNSFICGMILLCQVESRVFIENW